MPVQGCTLPLSYAVFSKAVLNAAANTYSQQYELRNLSFMTVSCNCLMSVCMCFVVIVRYVEFCSGTGTDKTHIVSLYKCLENNAGCEKQEGIVYMKGNFNRATARH